MNCQIMLFYSTFRIFFFLYLSHRLTSTYPLNITRAFVRKSMLLEPRRENTQPSELSVGCSTRASITPLDCKVNADGVEHKHPPELLSTALRRRMFPMWSLTVRLVECD